MGAHGYQRFPYYKPVVGQNNAFHAAPADRPSTYVVSAFPIQPTSFFPKFPRSSAVDVINSESKFYLWKQQYVLFLLNVTPSKLTGRKHQVYIYLSIWHSKRQSKENPLEMHVTERDATWMPQSETSAQTLEQRPVHKHLNEGVRLSDMQSARARKTR